MRLTIIDTTTTPTEIVLSLSENDVALDNVAEGTSPTVTVTATLSPADITLGSNAVVTITVGPGTAQAEDFTAVSNVTVTIPAGDTFGTASFSLTVTDDTDEDPEETLTVSGTADGFTTITSATLTIIDNDTPPTRILLSLSQDEVDEGVSPTVTVTAAFPQGSGAPTGDTVVTITVGDSGDSATEGTDYTPVADLTVTIAADGSVTRTFTFAPMDDTVFDPGETVTVSGSTTAAGFDPITPVTLTIIDTDTAPTEIVLSLSENDAALDNVAEGASPTVTVTAAFPLGSATLTGATVVTVAVEPNTAQAADFTAVTDVTVTIPAGDTSGTTEFSLVVTDDLQVEGPETLTVSGTTTATVITTITPATLTIDDNDTAPTAIALSLSAASVPEGDEGSRVPEVTVTAALEGGVTLTAATVVTISVVGGGPAADPGVDFFAQPGYEITIPINENSITASLQLVVFGDTRVDGDGILRISGSTSSLPVTPAELTLTILDDDIAPADTITLSLGPPSVLSVSEGDVGTTEVTVTVTATLAAALEGELPDTSVETVVQVSVAGGGTNAATVGEDFTAVPAVPLTIGVGETSGTASFTLTVTGDMLIERDETLVVSGSVTGDQTVGPATLTIVNDDFGVRPTTIALSLDPESVDEGDSGSPITTITVTASFSGTGSGSILTIPTAVQFTVVGDTATEGTDFDRGGGVITLIIPARETSGSGIFELAVIGDTFAEADETLTVSGTAAGFTVTPATLTITDESTDTDIAPTEIVLSLSENDVALDSVAEGASPTVTVTATLSPTSVTLPMATEVTVTVGDTGDTATEGTDYTTVGDITVTIPANGDTGTATFQFETTNDVFGEPDEIVTVSGTADGFTINQLTLAINNNDPVPTSILLVPDVTEVAEGDSQMIRVAAVFDPAGAVLEVDTTVSVVVGAVGDSATEGTDYTGVGDFTITILAGEPSTRPVLDEPGGDGSFEFAVTDDEVADTGETVTVSGTAAPFLPINPVMLTITDDDVAPTEIVLSLSSPAEREGNSAVIRVTATLSPTSVTLPDETVVTVSVGDTGDTATEGRDYDTVADFTLTIPAGGSSVEGVFVFVGRNDSVADPDETVTVSGTTTATVITTITSATLTITDDVNDTAPTTIVLSRNQAFTTNEGTNLMISVTAVLSPTSITLGTETVVTVTVGDSGDSATEGRDYTATPSTFDITIPAEGTSGSGTFRWVVMSDAVYDPNERVTISASAGGFDPITPLTLRIADRNTAPTGIALSLSEDNLLESSGTTTVMVTAALGTVSLTEDTVVTVMVAGTTATTGTDFTAPSSVTITIDAGATSVTGEIEVQVVEDTLAEEDEIVTVSGTAAPVLPVTSATLTIEDNDTAPTAIVLNLSETTPVDEGASPTVTVTATLSPTSVVLPADTVVAVTVGATGDTATEVTDYIPVVDLLVIIAAGETSGEGTFQFAPTDDTVFDPDETVTVSGTATGFDPIASLTLAIGDTDTAPAEITLSATPPRVTEGATTTVTVTATLSGTVTLTADAVVTVTVGDTGDTATEGTDYTAVTAFPVTIAAGATSGTGTFEFAVTDDMVVDVDETLTVSGTTTATTITSITSATLTIDDISSDPTSVILSLDMPSVTEGTLFTPATGPDVGPTIMTTSTVITVTAAYPSGTLTPTMATTVAVTVTGGTATAGSSTTTGRDFDEVTGFNVTILANETSGTATFTLVVLADLLAEGPETVTVAGTTTATEITTITPATLTITDDDTVPADIFLNFTPTNVVEGSSGGTTTTTIDVQAALFGSNVILSTDTVVTVSVAGGTATAGTDFTAVPGFTIIIPAEMDSGTGTFELEVNGDTLVEMNETLTVSGAATGFSVFTGFTPSAGELTIENDDAVPTAIDLSLDTTSKTEDSGTTSVTVTAAFSGSSTLLTTATEVTVSVAPGTTETADFTAVPAFTVTIPANMPSGTASFQLPVIDDTLVEESETVTVSGAATGFTIPATTLTITDNDIAPTNIALSVSPAAVLEGDSGDTTTPITVTASFVGSSTLTEATVVSVTVSSGTDPAEATVGVDYRSVTDFTVTIPVGMPSGTNSFDWVVIGGTVFDGDETVTVSGTAAPFTVDPATLTITEDDVAPTTIVLSLDLDPPSVTEGTTTTIAVTATLPGSVTLGTNTVVTVSVGPGTAQAADFTATPAVIPVTILAGQPSGTATFSLAVTDDTVTDPDETLTVSSTTPPDGFDAITPVTLTITDNDTIPTAIVLDLSCTPSCPGDSVAEGASPMVTVTATLSPTSVTLPDETVVTITVGDGTGSATEGTDYTMVLTTVTIPAGVDFGTHTFQFVPTDDTVAEPDETVTVSGMATDFTITPTTLTITDNDTAPTAIVLDISDPTSVAEGGSQTVTVTATLSPTSVTLPTETVVTVSVAGNTAEVVDFTAVGDFTLTIPALGTTSDTGTFLFVPTDDTVADSGETVSVSGTADTFTITSATLTITDTDTASTAITLSLNPTSVSENGGTTPVTVTATLAGSVSLATATEVTVTVEDGTATEGTDFTAVGNVTVTIPEDTLSGTATFQFAVMDDTVADPDETVIFSGTVAGGFDPITAVTLTIDDNDTAPTAITLSTTPTRVPEGASTTVMVTATLSPADVTLPIATEVTVSVADGTAVAGTDYTTPGSVTVTIRAGMPSSDPASFNLVVTEDTETDPDQTVTVSGMVVGTSLITTVTAATLTITDNDSPPTAIVLSLSDPTVVEGADPTVTVTAAFPQGSGTLTDPTVVTVSVGAGTATEGTDFTAVEDFSVTILMNASSGTATFVLTGTDDTLVEEDETLTVSGSTTTVGFGTIPSVTLTITDDDEAPTSIALSLSDPRVTEGDSPAPTVTVTAEFPSGSGTLTDATVVTVAVGDSGDSAIEGTDYTAVADLTVTIAIGATSGTATFVLAGADDTLAEEDEETLTVSATAPTGFDPIPSVTLTIIDDDDAPTAIVLSLSEPGGVTEGTSPTVTVTATLSPAGATLTADTVVTVSVAGGTAEAADFTAVSDFTLTIAAGAASGMATFDLAGTGDTLVEGDETLTVSGTLSGFTFTNTMLTIIDDDTAPTAIVLSLSQPAADEGADRTITVTATLSPTSATLAADTVVTVVVGDSEDSATEGRDYTTVADLMVTIAAGATRGTGTFQFVVTDDTVLDPGETVTVSGTASGFTFTNATLAITDDEDAALAPMIIGLNLSHSSVAEGASPTVTLTATLSPTHVTLPDATVVTVAVGAGTDSATEGTDYTMIDTVTVTIPAETLSGTGTFRFAVTDDTVFDTGETVTVSATAPAGFNPISSAVLTITNTDTAPMAITLSATPPRATEGQTTTVTVTATLSPANVTLTADTDVVVSVDSGTATEGTDFTAVADLTVTIPMGMSSSTPTTFNLVVADDLAIDPDETLTVSGTTTATVITTISSATLTIDDTDSPPSSIILSVDLDPASVDENSGSTPVMVTAAFPAGSATLTVATVVTVSVAADTAEAADFTAVGNVTVTIAIGATSGTGSFTLTVTDDTLVEGDETLSVSGTTTASGFTSIVSTSLTITDNDVAPTGITLSLNAASVSVAESSGTTVVTVTAEFTGSSSTLTSATEVTVSVAGNTATAGTDFTAVGNVTVTIAIGATSGTATFNLVVTDDTLTEGDETLSVSGTTTAPGFTAIASIPLTITDDDTAPAAIALSLNTTSVIESSGTTTVTVTAAFSGSSSTVATATRVTVSVGAGTAEVADFTAVGNVTVTIPANMTSGTATFNLAVTEDTLVEGPETVTVSGMAGTLTVSDATLTITDNDTAPTAIALSLNPASVAEDSSATSITVTASFSGSNSNSTLTSATEVTVTVAGNTATAGTDYTKTPAAITVTIPVNRTSGTASFTLVVTDDTLEEGSETVTVSGSTAATGFGTISSVTLTITDDDTSASTIVLSLTPTSAVEGATTAVTVTAALGGTVSRASVTNVTVSVAAGTASTADFTAVTAFTVPILANMLSGTASFNLVVTEDTVVEPDETLTVSGMATGFTITSTTLTITDNDTAPTSIALSLNPTSVTEGATTPVAVTAAFPGSVSLATATDVTVSVAGNTATAGTDFTAVSDFTVTIPAGATSGTANFSLAMTDDTLVEGNETVTVSGTAAASFGTLPTVTLTITDDDAAPTTVILTLAPDRVQEDSGTTTIAVSVAYPGGVTLTTATEVTVSVAGGTADEADFTAVSDFTLTIAVGESSSAGSFDLTVTEDEESEGNETLTVSAAATGLTTASATLTILEVDSTAVVMEVVPELARLSVTSVIDAVADRVGRAVAGTANTLVSFAGHQSLAPALAANEQRLNDGDLSWREVLKNSSFDLNLEGTDEEAGSGGGQADPSGNVGIWASGSYESVSSQDAVLGAWEGDLFSVHAGVDMRVAENVLVGVGINRSEGSFEFEDDEGRNADTRLTTLNPYLGWNSGEGAGLWATVGYGKGNVEFPGLDEKRDLTMTMAALGGSMDVSVDSVDDEVSLTVKGSASTARLVTAAIDDEPAVTADVQRLRLALEAQGVTVHDAGEKFTRSAALGIRYDGGDGDTGLGAELGGELGWLVPATGVTLRATGHVLLAHQSDLKEWGVGGLIRYDVPGSSEGRGVSLRLQPSYGAESDSGQLWEHQVTELESESDDAPGARLAMGLDWGLSALSGRGLLTPYGNLELSEDGERVYRLGGRFEIGPAIHIDLGGDRKEAADETPEHGIDLSIRVDW